MAMKTRICSFLIVLALFISIFPQNIFAASEEYGTVEDGIKGNATTLTPLDSLKNGDFSEGLRYWGPYPATSVYTSTKADYMIDDGNGYISINREEATNAAQGIVSVPVKISNLSVGDEIFFFLDYGIKIYDANIAGASFYAQVLPLDSSTTAFSSKLLLSFTSNDVSKWTNSSASATVKTLPESGEGVFYIRIYLQYKAAARIDLDNIAIAIKRNSGENQTPDGYYDLPDGTRVAEYELNTALYGTVDDGIKGNALELNPFNVLKNGDFSEGLKYWGNQSKSGLASSVASIQKEGDNSFLVIEREEPDNSAKGVITAPFKVDDLQKGDVVAIMYDYKIDRYDASLSSVDYYANFFSTDGNSFEFSNGKNQMQISGLNAVENETVQTPEGWTTTAAQMIVGDIAEDYVPTFYIQLYMQYKAAGEFCFDNFKVYVKYNSNEHYTPDGYYETLDGELVSDKLFKGCTVNTSNGDIASGDNDINYPGLVYSWIGTEEDGIYTEKNYLGTSFPVRTKFMNSDFSKGLQYWFESSSTGYTSDKVALKTEENGENYISIGENGVFYQINQTCFWLQNFEAGDEVYVLVKFRKFGNFKCDAYVLNAIEGEIATTRAHGSLKVIYEPESDDDWGYSVSNNYLTIPAISQVNPNTAETYGGNFAYYIMLSSEELTDMSDIMLVIKNDDGTYTDSDGNIIIIPENSNSYHYDTIDGFDWTKIYGVNCETTSNFWAGAYNKSAANLFAGTSKTENAITVKANLLNDGSLIFEDYEMLNSSVSSAIFKLPENVENISNRKILFEYNLISDYDNANFIIEVKSGVNTHHSTFYSHKIGYEIGCLPLDFINSGDSCEISFKSSKEIQNYIKNITLGYDDIGGIEGLYAKTDGTPYGFEIGDANADNVIDARDLVRMKKFIAQTLNTDIYYAAANIDNDDNVSATDLGALRKILLTK